MPDPGVPPSVPVTVLETAGLFPTIANENVSALVKVKLNVIPLSVYPRLVLIGGAAGLVKI